MSNYSGKIGIVTVLFKSDDVLEGFFKSISIQTYNNHVIYIIDNSPSDATDSLIEALTQKYLIGEFLHIRNNCNVGVAAGNNAGIRLALEDGCEHILLANNDIEFEQPELFLKLVNKAVNEPQFLFVPKILFFDSRRIWMAGGKIDLWKPMTKHIGEGEKDQKKYNSPKLFDYAPTCFMLIHESVFDKVGLMDEKYFVYFDDTDFMYRASKLNLKVFYLPDLIVLHKISTSTGGKESLFSIYYSNRNRIYFIRKHLRGTIALISCAYTIVTRIIKMITYSRTQREKLIQGLIDGYKIPL